MRQFVSLLAKGQSTERVGQMRVIIILPLLALIVVGMTGCPPPPESEIRVTVTGPGQNAVELTQEEIVALARREGEFWWYTSLPEQQARDFLARFEGARPFITTHLVRGSTFELVQRIDRELARGQLRADALHVLDPAVFDDLRRRGELYAYDSPHARYIPADYQEPGHWAAMRAVTICIAYDPARLPADEVPRTWAELLAPRWEGRLSLKDAQTGGSAYAQYYHLREEYGRSYWRRMAEHRPQLHRSSADTLRALAAEEIDVAGGILGYSVHGAQLAGASVEAVWPEDGVPLTIGPIAVLSRSPHPHAGIVFMDWALSREGQQAIVDISSAYSLREDVDPAPGRPRLSELNLLRQHGTWSEYRTRQERLQSEYSQFFHPESE